MSKKNKMIKIQAIETNEGVLIRKPYTYNGKWLYNGSSEFRTTLDSRWIIIDKPLKNLELSCTKYENKRYVIKDVANLTSDMKESYTLEEFTFLNESYDREVKRKYEDISTLYKYKQDAVNKKEIQEFEYEVLATLDKLPSVKDFKFPVFVNGRYKHDGVKNITHKNVEYDLVSKIVLPAPLLSEVSCKLTVKQSYDIIRHHVLSHIDGRYAKVTSDYDFCFSVEKVIELAEPLGYFITEGKGKRAKRVKKYRNTRNVKLLHISPKEYQDYKVIKPFEGTNHEDLELNIKNYLTSLMVEINKPLVDCECCKGRGVIIKTDLDPK